MKGAWAHLLGLFLGACFAPLCGATVYYSDGSAANVQALHVLAQDGDTIALPSGTFTWPVGVTISKGITLQGAGYDLTTLGRAIGWTGHMINIQGLASDLPVRVTGIRFNSIIGQLGDLTSVYVQGPYCTVWGNYKIRIDHCYFSGGQRDIFFKHRAYGVVDHCVFNNTVLPFEVYGDDDCAWGRSMAFGTSEAVFIEDNLFTSDGNLTYFDTLGDTYTGGRYTWRHNTFDLTQAPPSSFGSLVEAHGNQAYWQGINNWNRGGIMCEFYDNTVHMSQVFRVLWFRGGRNLVANNTFTTVSGFSSAALVAFSEEEPTRILPLRTNWDAEDQVNNTFIWGNMVNGAPQIPSMIFCWDSASVPFVQLGRDYWLEPPSGNTETIYPQPGPPSLPGYPAPYNPAVTSWARYTYPHPLTGSSSSPTPMPSASPSPTPTSTVTPTPTPTPTTTPRPTPVPITTPPPSLCSVPNFIGARLRTATTLWEQAGFNPANITIAGGRGQRITWQSLPAGSSANCATATLTVGP